MNIRLAKPLEKALRAGHPWIFRNALEPFKALAGDVVTVLDRGGNFLCRGLADDGPLGVRVYTIKDVPLDDALFRTRIRAALQKRSLLWSNATTALRLISGEGDFLPGLVIDVYGSFAVMLCDGLSLLTRKDLLAQILQEELAPFAVSTLLSRTRSGHEKKIEALFGPLPPQEFPVRENDMNLIVNLMEGQKTGLFLDHRDSRMHVRSLATGKRMLNLYGYTGGFSIAAGLGGALEVTTVDSAKPAIELAHKSWLANNLDPQIHSGVAADVPTFMKSQRTTEFDLVVADPPSFAPKKSAVDEALKAYTMLHSSVFRVMKSGGIYIAASCSSHIRKDMFEATIQDAAQVNKRKISIAGMWGAGKDHPVLKAFPEGNYLKVFKILVQS